MSVGKKRLVVEVTQSDIHEAKVNKVQRRAALGARIFDKVPPFLCPGMLAIARALGIPAHRVVISYQDWWTTEKIQREGYPSQSFVDNVVRTWDQRETVRVGRYYLEIETNGDGWQTPPQP